MNDILPPKRPLSPPPIPVDPTPVPTTPPQPEIQPPSPPIKKSKMSLKRKIGLWSIGGALVLVALIIAALVAWYTVSLKPVATGDTRRVRVQISGSSSEVGQLLESKKLIQSKYAFEIYTRLSHTSGSLKAGTYSLSPSQSTEDIVSHIISGKVDQFDITFLPGATLAENRSVLIKAGYNEADVDVALSKTYDSPLFLDKPANADLEGYIYGETYNFDSSMTVEQVLEKTFDQYYSAIQENDLITGFKEQGLNLYQGITLASIIQREVPTPTDQKQVAQIFLKRYNAGTPLGSDVTAYYGADKAGETRSVAVDTPYNTRIHPGLPPGPIGSPGLTALEAVAHPTEGDYLFFLSGDDDVTYYARTDAEHEANIRDHCKVKCAVQ
jgi:UPF0755 protein